MKPQPLSAASAMLALFVSILWGGNVVALKLGLETVPPLWSAFWRFAFGFSAVWAWAKIQGVKVRPNRDEAQPFVVLGTMFVAQIMLLNFGVSFTSPAYAVVLLNSHPVFTNVVGHFVASEDGLSPRRVLGIVLAFTGILWVAAGTPGRDLAPRPLLGNIFMLLSAALLAIRVIYTRQLVQRVHPLRPVLWQMGFSLPVFAGIAALIEPTVTQPLTWEPVAALLYQGVLIAGFCFVVWTTLLKRHSASTLSMFGFAVPFFGVVLSSVVFGEPIDPRLLIGAALVTVGIVIVTRQQPKPMSLPDEPAQTKLEEATR